MSAFQSQSGLSANHENRGVILSANLSNVDSSHKIFAFSKFEGGEMSFEWMA
jgi:hypothetical protein